jgi:hypothetical protein
MDYCKIDQMESREHLMKLIDLIYNEVLSAGGDGDALWYSRFYDINDIYPLIKEYNDKTPFPWAIELKDKTINWGQGQEWAMITNDEDFYNMFPEWCQMKIRY